MPKVSVVVPVYNVAEYLGQCLDTILLQTLQDIEVICVDDGSTDGSLDILNTYAFLDARLKVIHQENKGLGPARNRGMIEATGEFIIFLDSDDFFHPEMLEKMLVKIEKDNSDIAICGYTLFDNEKEEDYWEEKIEEKYLAISPISSKNCSTDLFNICSAAVWTKLFRRQFIKNHGLKFNNEYAEDIPFSYTAMALSSKISFLEDCCVHYRQNRKGQLTGDRHKKHGANVFIPLSELYNNLKKVNLIDTFLTTYQKRVFKVLTYELNPRSFVEKRDFLNQFIKKLPSHLSNIVFGYGNGKTKVSIIIPVYNAAEFLPKCLDSCLNQTLKEIEIICVDDGSTDNSLEILNEYAKRDNRVIVLHQQNQRQAIARNKAMEVATGRYIQFLDADDYLEPDACEILYLYSEIFCLEMCQYSAIEFYHHNKKEFENPYHCLIWLSDTFPSVFNCSTIPHLLPNMAVTACLTIYRHDFLIKNNITWINKKIAYEDTPFFSEAILKANRVGAIKVPFYHRRVHSVAITQQMATNFNEYMEILKYTLKRIKKLTDKDLFTLYCAVFLQKAWGNFAKLAPDNKLNMAASLYDFCFNLQQKYHFTLPADIYSWSQGYLKTLQKNKKESL